MDFSRLRPAGTKVLNSANQSSGAVHWMKFIDGIGSYVGQKGRIPAMLFSLRIDHPDIESFVTVKSDYTKIQNANISVQITDKFYKAVENDDDWELKFEIPTVKKGDKVWLDVHSLDLDCKYDKESKRYYKVATHDRTKEKFTKTVKAKKLLELIAKNMHDNAEPGIQNIDTARKYSNSDFMYDPEDEYDSRILSTNACSEQYLSRESLCVLASMNCGKFSNLKEIFVKQLEKIAVSMNRLLDNVNECELVYQTFATPHQKLAINKLRRTGAGVTNIVGWLFKKNLLYGSPEGNDAVEEFIKYFNYWLYVSSEQLGKEKGNFGLFDKEKWKKAPFVARTLEFSTTIDKQFNAPVLTGNYARNVTCSSIAPTGTLSLMFRDMVLSYGIEPAFFMYFWKRTRMAGKYEYYFCVPKAVRDAFESAGAPIPIQSDTIRDEWNGRNGKSIAEFIEKNKDKANVKIQSSTEISPMNKLQMMTQVMKWVDSSISTTYLLPEGSDWKSVYKFIIEAHKKEIKSIAAFPDKKMYGIVSSIPFKDLAFKLKAEDVVMHPDNFADDELVELNISRENIKASFNSSPKRLESLDADIYAVNVKNQRFVIVIGLQNGQPYEIFGGHLNGIGLKTNFKKGKISKVKRGQYALEFDDIYIEDFSKQFTPTEQILFRMASMSLRHGVPIHYVVEQLQKAQEDITSMASAAVRVLKKYISNGLIVAGQSCPSCGNGLVYIDGCVTCSSCNWSKCG
jgi:ribonucleoside-diphosphate reductase alpha chain